MVYSDEQRAVHVAQIRKIQTASGQGQNTPGRYIQEQLRANGYDLGLNYICRITRKIARQYAQYTERRTMDQMRIELEKNYSMHLEKLYEIVFAKSSKKSDVISALREARETYESVYSKREALEYMRADLIAKLPQADPQYVVSAERLKEIVDSAIRFGVLPKQKNGNTLTAGTAGADASPKSP